jgi:hypothetical protein
MRARKKGLGEFFILADYRILLLVLGLWSSFRRKTGLWSSFAHNTIIIKLIKKEWALVSQEYINKRVLLIPERFKAVIEANGNITDF